MYCVEIEYEVVLRVISFWVCIFMQQMNALPCRTVCFAEG